MRIAFHDAIIQKSSNNSHRVDLGVYSGKMHLYLEGYMDHYRTYLARLKDGEQEDRAFLRDHLMKDTVTLHDLLVGRSWTATRLGAPWIDTGLLQRSVARSVQWIAEHRALPNKPWLFFYQRNDPDLDALYRKKDRETLPAAIIGRFRGAKPQVRYLHVATEWYTSLIRLEYGDDFSRWRIRPLMFFRNENPYKVQPLGANTIFGMIIPNLPELLGVSNEIATIYLARIITHDIGHGLLLPVNRFEEEPLHDAGMIIASGLSEERPVVHSEWEQFVLDECTDTTFMLTSAERIRRFSQDRALTTTQRWYANGLKPLVTPRNNLTVEHLRALFRIPINAPTKEARAYIEQRIEEERAGNFPSWHLAKD